MAILVPGLTVVVEVLDASRGPTSDFSYWMIPCQLSCTLFGSVPPQVCTEPPYAATPVASLDSAPQGFTSDCQAWAWSSLQTVGSRPNWSSSERHSVCPSQTQHLQWWWAIAHLSSESCPLFFKFLKKFLFSYSFPYFSPIALPCPMPPHPILPPCCPCPWVLYIHVP